MKLLNFTTKSNRARPDGTAMIYYDMYYVEEFKREGLYFGEDWDSKAAPKGWTIA